MKLKQIIDSLRINETSCRQEASGNLDGNRSEGLNCIGDSLAEAIKALSALARRNPVFLTAKQRKALISLAGNAERDDLIAALTTDDQTAGYFNLITKPKPALLADPISECDNCSWKGTPKIGLEDIPDLSQRLDEGGTVPSGECPKCGALCYEKKVKNKKPAQQTGILFRCPSCGKPRPGLLVKGTFKPGSVCPSCGHMEPEDTSA